MSTRKMFGAAVAMAAVVSVLAPAEAAVEIPDGDAFFVAPAIIDEEPGTVLRSRPVTLTAIGIPVPYQAFHVMYASTDVNDDPSAVVATVIKPSRDAATSPRPLLSYQEPYDAIALKCAPSYALRAGNDINAAALVPALESGWAVVDADYEGLDGHYTVGIQAAHGVLDGIRAAQTFLNDGGPGFGAYAGIAGSAGYLAPESPIGLWGYSGGALASAWASELAPTYAPELNIVGVAEGGTPPDITAIADNIDGGAFAGIELAGSAAMARAYPQLMALMNDAGKQMAQDIAKLCINEYTSQYSFQTLDAYTNVPNAIHTSLAQAILEQNKLGKRFPTAPLYIYHAMADELIPMRTVNTMVAAYCDNDVTLSYYQDPASDHISLAFTGAPAAFAWLQARFAGVPAQSSCAVPPIPGAPAIP